MSVQILTGDCRRLLETLAADSVQCVVTSPPYWGLRDYDVAGQIGLEADPMAYVAELVAVFAAVRRVLRPSGTLFLNLGDSYSAGGNGGHQRSGPAGELQTLEGRRDRKTPSFHGHKDRGLAERLGERRKAPLGLKPKDLVGIPWMVAFALRADGWWLRQEIIWHKPNPMPESVADRCTKAHEQVFLFTKSGQPTIWRSRDTREWSEAPDLTERLSAPLKGQPDRTVNRWRAFDYFFDQDALAEAVKPDTYRRAADGRSETHKWADGGPGGQTIATVSPSVGTRRAPGNRTHKGTAEYEASGDQRHRTKAGLVAFSDREAERVSLKNSFARATKDGGGVTGEKPQFREDREPISYDATANRRSVWTIATEPFGEAHFATFPTALARDCMLAGSRPGDLVLDPFGGSGTVGLVADRLQRNAVLCELNPKYAAMARRRIAGDAALLAQVS